MPTSGDIQTDRFSLIPLDRPTLEAMAAGSDSSLRFQWPGWWPDEVDLLYVELWLHRASSADPLPPEWGPRAMVTPGGELIGHAGFQGSPLSIGEALGDPTYRGPIASAEGMAVEFGYTVFPDHRGNGYAAEAAAALIEWVRTVNEVSTVLATVDPANLASIRVLDRVGGFIPIGVCIDDEGETETVFRMDW